MKKIALLSLLFFSNTYAAQSIQIHAQLPDNSPSAQLLFVVDDLDTGKKTPEIMSLQAGQNLQTFSVVGDHYQIILWKLQASNVAFTPCALSKKIDNRSLIVTFNTQTVLQKLHCSYRETATMPQLYLPATSQSASVASAPVKTTDSKTGYAEIAKYLTALSHNCTPGDFHANFEAQKIDYTILGMKSGACDVTINVNQEKKPLLCHFNNNDLALLASPTQIQNYTNGTVTNSPHDLNARIMNARCKAM